MGGGEIQNSELNFTHWRCRITGVIPKHVFNSAFNDKFQGQAIIAIT